MLQQKARLRREWDGGKVELRRDRGESLNAPSALGLSVPVGQGDILQDRVRELTYTCKALQFRYTPGKGAVIRTLTLSLAADTRPNLPPTPRARPGAMRQRANPLQSLRALERATTRVLRG